MKVRGGGCGIFFLLCFLSYTAVRARTYRDPQPVCLDLVRGSFPSFAGGGRWLLFPSFSSCGLCVVNYYSSLYYFSLLFKIIVLMNMFFFFDGEFSFSHELTEDSS